MLNQQCLGSTTPTTLFCRPNGLFCVGSDICLWLAQADISYSWCLQFPGGSTVLLSFSHSFIQHHPWWSLGHSHPGIHCLEIWLEASMTTQHLHSTCLQNQHHMDNAKVCYQCQQETGFIALWLQPPLNSGGQLNEGKHIFRKLLVKGTSQGSPFKIISLKRFCNLILLNL